jgi:hypothetical protein
MSDPQDRAEALDGDKLPDAYPPDEPMGVDEPEVTPLGEATSESFEERDERTEREPDTDDEVVQPYSEVSEDVLDAEAQAVAEANPEDRDPASDSAPPAAEEAAMHIEEG